MATLSDLRTYTARALRDTSNGTWSTSELDDLINRGISELGSFYPREIMSTIGTVAAGTLSYGASSYTNIYRIDTYSGTTYMGTLPHGTGDPDSGWELHNSIVWLPPTYTVPTGYTLRAWGYGGYAQLSASSQVTDLDQAGIWAVVLYAQKEAIASLLADRAKFRQWQTDSNNTDISLLQLNQLYGLSAARWASEVRRLRKLRKLG